MLSYRTILQIFHYHILGTFSFFFFCGRANSVKFSTHTYLHIFFTTLALLRPSYGIYTNMKNIRPVINDLLAEFFSFYHYVRIITRASKKFLRPDKSYARGRQATRIKILVVTPFFFGYNPKNAVTIKGRYETLKTSTIDVSSHFHFHAVRIIILTRRLKM